MKIKRKGCVYFKKQCSRAYKQKKMWYDKQQQKREVVAFLESFILYLSAFLNRNSYIHTQRQTR